MNNNTTAQIVNIEEHRPIIKADADQGFDRVSHTITDFLCQANLSGREFKVVLAVIAKTYRYHKKSDWISNSQIAEKTGIAESNISRIKKSLVDKFIIFQDGRKVGVNSTVSEWKINSIQSKTTNKKVSQKRLDLSQKRLEVQSKTTKKLVENDLHNRKTNNTKETNTKEYGVSRKKNSSSAPDEMIVDQDMIAWAKKTGVTVNLENETEQFLDYHRAKDNKFANWKAAWQTWMRNSMKFNKQNTFSKSKAKPEQFNNTDYGQIIARF